ncbi:MAG: 4Fe-4S binding protein [Deferribacterota bacterium]|nr:4Fe-4S binding protein [Deferribacterota bacterium]
MEILESLLVEFESKFKFNIIYKEHNFPFYNGKVTFSGLPANKAMLILKNASTGGNNILAFLFNTPNIPLIDYTIENSFILITLSATFISIPTIIINSVDELENALMFSLYKSRSYKLPINIVIPQKIKTNFNKNNISIDYNFEYIKPTINKTNGIDILSLKNRLIDIEDDFKNLKKKHNNIIYYIPQLRENDEKDYNFSSKVFLEEDKYRQPDFKFKLDNILCPGCPFLILHNNKKLQYDEIYTSIDCGDIKDIFSIKKCTLFDFIGIKNNKHSLFIGNLTEIESELNCENIIFLNNMDIKHKKNYAKIDKEINIFDYSCNNILKKKPLKVTRKKCLCINKGKYPECIAKTHCPALFIEDNTVNIDESLCVGCKVCKILCPYGAIK